MWLAVITNGQLKVGIWSDLDLSSITLVFQRNVDESHSVVLVAGYCQVSNP